MESGASPETALSAQLTVSPSPEEVFASLDPETQELIASVAPDLARTGVAAPEPKPPTISFEKMLARRAAKARKSGVYATIFFVGAIGASLLYAATDHALTRHDLVLPIVLAVRLALTLWKTRRDAREAKTLEGYARERVRGFLQTHQRALARRRRQLAEIDPYGVTRTGKWEAEKRYFITRVLAPQMLGLMPEFVLCRAKAAQRL